MTTREIKEVAKVNGYCLTVLSRRGRDCDLFDVLLTHGERTVYVGIDADRDQAFWKAKMAMRADGVKV